MNKKVVVTADAAGRVVVPSQNPEFGYIRIEQTRMIVGEDGWLRPRLVSTLIHGRFEDLKLFGFKAGQTLEGKITIQESLTPFNKKEPARDAKVAGKTGIVCTYMGAPIYRRHSWDETGTKLDELVEHDNVEMIREAFQKLEAAEAGTVTNSIEEKGNLVNPN